MSSDATSSDATSSDARSHVAFYFDVVCPYAYLAHTQIEAVCKRAGVTLTWVPILLGGLFRDVRDGDGDTRPSADMPAMGEAKSRLNLLDMQRWSEHWEVPLSLPDAHPRRTVLAMRAIIASGDVPRAASALFRRYWRDGLDIADETVVRDTLDAEGFAGAEVVAVAGEAATKHALRDNTDAAVKAGAFGVPTFVVQREGSAPALIWGQDRMHFIAVAARGELLCEVPS